MGYERVERGESESENRSEGLLFGIVLIISRISILFIYDRQSHLTYCVCEGFYVPLQWN